MLVSTAVGALGSALIVATAFLIVGGSMVGALIFFTAPSAYLIGTLVPTEFWYSVVPEGGGPAAILLFAAAAWFQLTAILGFVTYGLLRIWRQKIAYAHASL